MSDIEDAKIDKAYALGMRAGWNASQAHSNCSGTRCKPNEKAAIRFKNQVNNRLTEANEVLRATK